MTENLLTMKTEETPEAAAVPANPSQAPLNVPPKFWDEKKQEIRVDALLKSYAELEKKLAKMIDAEKLGPAEINRMRGVPEKADEYVIDLNQSLLENDPDVNARMHEAGFTADQVQLVYNLASEKMLPLIVELAAEFQADKEVERLKDKFGGADKWAEISRQLLAFGKKNLPAEVLSGMTTSYDGVMALYALMNSGKPLPIGAGNNNSAVNLNEADIKKLMQSPKYWREKDPKVIAQVSEGFKRIYGE